MKKIVFGLVSLVFVVMLIPGYATAEGAQDPATTDSNKPTISDITESEKAEKLKERVQEYKDKLNKKLTSAENKRISSVCKSAQMVTAKVGTNVGIVKENRTQIYTKISEKLSGVVGKLQKAGIDTTELEASLDVLQPQVDQLLVDVDAYQALINDLSEMDCVTNPDAFKSALEQAKAKRLELFNSSKEIRNYIQENIKPQLQSLREQLNQATDTTSEGGNQ